MRERKWSTEGLVAYAQKHTTKECADKFGCTKRAMQTYLSRNKIKHLKENMSEKQRGANNSCYRHGGRYTRLYRIWVRMKDRCNNPKHVHYDDYGGRGIRICKDWYNFATFQQWALHNGYSDELTLDRIDNNMGYSPDNCRWVDRVIQQNNTRYNRLLTYKGQTKTMTQWAREIGLNRNTLESRIRLGWSTAEAIETPRR